MVKFHSHHYWTLLALTDVSSTKMLRSARMASSVVLRGRVGIGIERPKHLDFNSFRHCQRIFKFNTQVSYRAVHLRMPQ
jgi:hypothetical protein